MAFAAVVTAVILMLVPAQPAEAAGAAVLTGRDNRVEISRAGGNWSSAVSGQELQIGDRVKTGENSRATVRMSDGSVLQLDEFTTIEIKAPKAAGSTATLSVPGGTLFFSNQGRSREVQIETPTANGAIRGTAFLLAVNGNSGESAVSMIEGSFGFSNEGGDVNARPGDQVTAQKGARPSKDRYADTGDTAAWYLVIEGQFPGVRTLRSADKVAFMNAVPSSIKRYPNVAPNLSGGATLARKEWARDILEEAFRAVGADCGMRGRVLKSVIAAVPELASELTELAISLGPECAGAYGGGGEAPPSGGDGFGAGPTNVLPPPGSIGGGGGQGNVVAVCQNGVTVFVSPAEAQRLLQNSGNTLGACVVTPVTNR